MRVQTSGRMGVDGMVGSLVCLVLFGVYRCLKKTLNSNTGAHVLTTHASRSSAVME